MNSMYKFPMNNKEMFINGFIERISKRFNIDKDKAFEVFSISTILEKPFEEVFNDILTNKNCRGIDGISFDEQDDDNYCLMEIFQCKNSKSLKLKELKEPKSVFKDVFIDGRTDELNVEGLKEKSDKYKSIAQSKIIEHNIYFIFNGDKSDANTSNEHLFKSYHKPDENYLIVDSNELYKRIKNLIKKSRKEIKFNFKLENSNITRETQALISYSILNIRAVNFRLSLLELCKLVEQEIETNDSDDFLFSENIRGFLGDKSTNKKIRETLEDSKLSSYFPFLNNGITMICSDMTVPPNQQDGKYIVPTTNPIIVNGRQTTKVIYEFYKKNKENNELNKLDGIYVNVRLYETKDSEIIDKITEATNTQSPINYRDKISNKEFQEYTKTHFHNKGVAYITHRGEIFDSKLLKEELKEYISADKVIKFWYASFYEKPEIAKVSIAKVLKEVHEATNGENILKELFNGDKDSPIYSQLYTTYKILRIVTKKRKENNTKDDFIEHSDELFAYGILKEIISTHNNKFTDDNLNKAYEAVFDTIKLLVDEEKKKKEEKEETYSHNNYFKSSKCRIDYNSQKNISEENEMINKLKSFIAVEG